MDDATAVACQNTECRRVFDGLKLVKVIIPLF